MTVSPMMGLPLSLSSDWSTSDERLRAEPVSAGLSERSSPVRERAAVE